MNGEIMALKEKYRNAWRKVGFQERLIDMAISMADEWTLSMANTLAPPHLRIEIIKHIYPTALETSDRWIRKVG